MNTDASQSATSIQLSNLEEAVGAKLLSRTGRGIRLTEAGEVLYTLSERMLNVWQEVSDEMESYLGEKQFLCRQADIAQPSHFLKSDQLFDVGRFGKRHTGI